MDYLEPMERALAEAAAAGLVWGQARVAPGGRGWVVAHVADDPSQTGSLAAMGVAELRALANTTEAGEFRPLKSAPNLRRGWRFEAGEVGALRECLEALYPGSVADWFAARSGSPDVVHFREFVNRQTGMYRITQLLSDTLAGRTIRAACHGKVCLKRRLWTVEGLAPDEAEGKSLIPCLDPCAVLLDFARKSIKAEREEKVATTLTPMEVETMLAALERALAEPPVGGREADTGNPLNTRRLLLALDGLRAATTPVSRGDGGP